MHYLLELSREFRKNPTLAEKIMWSSIRSKKLSGFKFRRQYRIDRYIVDFICLSRKLIVELDGEQHAFNVEYDMVRTRYLIARGYKELRFANHEVLYNLSGVIYKILMSLNHVG